ncbi:hypothetical protein IWW37_000246 [Coemansia sp. RSA 2050]|nr:hypothetical protein IWW37_000246 [Coemansia sp. RSA 2050]KAJ2737202.1 hypothetical protein IW152_000223 [Coemansia sp. BCRC 34962]
MHASTFQPLVSQGSEDRYTPTLDKNANSGSQQYAVGLLMLRRLYQIFAVLLGSQTPRHIGLGCGALLVGKLSAEVVFYYAGRLPSEFYKVLGDKDLKAFFPLLLRCMAVVAAAGTAHAALDYGAAALGVMMRSALTTHTHKRYIRARAFYETVTGGTVDNPDQRITQDMERLSSTMATILPELLVAPFLIAYYTVRCWSMAGPLGPLAIYAYFVAGALSTRAVMPPIIRGVYHQEREEGNFRFQEIRITEFAESIAFFAGEDRERTAADAALGRVIGVQHALLRKQFWLGLITQVFSYLGATVSYAIIAVPIFLGKYDAKTGSELSSIISMNAFVSMYLIYRFSVVIEQAKRLSDIAGYTARVVQLWEEVDRIEDMEYHHHQQEEEEDSDEDDMRIVAENVTVSTPSGDQVLVSALTVDVVAGRSLIITGPNGVGKTSVLRTLCGLWRPAAGSVRVPRHELFFLPQAAYIVSGSLREQLSYPGQRRGKSSGSLARVCGDADLARLLSAVGLAQLVGRITSATGASAADHLAYDRPYPVRFWLKVLSPGEQQKISAARALFWRPRFAILDECTSALDSATEANIYQALVDAGITLVSVSHRQSLLKYHHMRLDLLPQGQYSLAPVYFDACDVVSST